MNLTFIQALLYFSVCAILGIFVGLLIRLIREKVELGKLIRGFSLAIEFLIVYPIILPFIILLNKKEFVDFLVLEAKEDYGGKVSRKKLNRLREEIEKSFTVGRIFLLWMKFLKYITSDFDIFVKRNIELVRTFTSSEGQKQDVLIKISDIVTDNDEPDTFDDFSEDVTQDQISFFGFGYKYKLRQKLALLAA